MLTLINYKKFVCENIFNRNNAKIIILLVLMLSKDAICQTNDSIPERKEFIINTSIVEQDLITGMLDIDTLIMSVGEIDTNFGIIKKDKYSIPTYHGNNFEVCFFINLIIVSKMRQVKK